MSAFGVGGDMHATPIVPDLIRDLLRRRPEALPEVPGQARDGR